MSLGEGDVDKLGLSLRKLISELHDPQTERGGQESLDSGAPPVPVTMDLTQENTRAGSSGPRPTYSLTFHRKEFFFFPVCVVITFFSMYLYNTSNLSHFLEAYKPIPYYPLSYVGIRAHKPCWHSSFYCLSWPTSLLSCRSMFVYVLARHPTFEYWTGRLLILHFEEDV